jgi:hypothetical protein
MGFIVAAPGGVATSGEGHRRGNLINYEDPAQLFRRTLQGIGCFDGMFVDWVVENNVIITDHWQWHHALGAQNARVVNTVIDLNDVIRGLLIRLSTKMERSPTVVWCATT